MRSQPRRLPGERRVSRVNGRRVRGSQHPWQLTCILCARSVEVDVVPTQRRCGACGGYCEANRTTDCEEAA